MRDQVTILAESNSFSIEQSEGRTLVVSVVGHVVADLTGGIGPLIAATFFNLSKHDKARADDYMVGVMQGATHALVTR